MIIFFRAGMADPLNLEGIEGLNRARADIATIEASCVTGFEAMACEEVRQRLGCEAVITRGRVVFDIQVERVRLVAGLRTINTVWVMLGHTEDAGYPDTEDAQMDTLRSFVHTNLDWDKGLRVWQLYTGFQGEMHPGPGDENKEPDTDGKRELAFRCTCYRTGTGHKFKSTEVQAAVGGAVHDKFHWNVSCKGYDLEFVINCDKVSQFVAIQVCQARYFVNYFSSLNRRCRCTAASP